MIIGVPKEIKAQEHRVGLVPSSVRELVSRGHDVWMETKAGAGIGFDDGTYREAGAHIAKNADEVFETAELIIKVKEPQPAECKKLREEQILFTYLHLAPDPKQAKGLMDSGCTAIAFETVTDDKGRLPLLAPMSEVAGRLSVQVGAYHMQKHNGGTGRLISGVPGVKPAKVLIIGGGVAGFHAAQMATGLSANVTILERSNDRMRFLDDYFHGRANIVYSNEGTIEQFAFDSDLIVGAALVPGGKAPILIRKERLKSMHPGTVMVDIAIDQGGCFETSKPTTHDKPTYVIDNVVHYCVANMPGAVPLTSALALNHSILPYVLELADKGWKAALADNEHLRGGLNVAGGHITHIEVAEALGFEHRPYS